MPTPTPASSSLPPRRATLRRWLRLLVLVYVGYLLSANLFLNLPLGERVFGPVPQRFAAHWRYAVSPWPGYVLARDVSTIGHVRHVRWQSHAEYASARIGLLPLLWRELHIASIHGHELRVWAERIDDFMPPRERSPDAWTVNLPQVRSDSLIELRWNDLRLIGHGSGTLALRKELRSGPLQILPSSFRMNGARLTQGDLLLLSDAEIDASLAIDEHVPQAHPGRAKLALIDAELQVDAALNAQQLSPPGPDADRSRPRPSDGRFNAQLHFDHGRWRDGSRLDLQLPLPVPAAGGRWIENVLSIEAKAGSKVQLHATMPALPDSSARLDAALTIDTLALPLDGWGELLDRSSGRVSTRWHFESLRWISDLLLRKPWLRLDGGGNLDADLQLADGRLLPGSRFELPTLAVEASVLDDRISGDGNAHGGVSDAPTDAQRPLQIALALQQFAIAPLDTPGQPYVQGEQLSLDLAADARLSAFRDSLVARLRFAGAAVPQLAYYNRFLPRGDLRFVDGHGMLGSDLTLDARGQVERGQLALRARRAALRMARLDLLGDLDVDLQLARSDLQQKRFVLDGSRIELRDVGYRDGDGAAREGWWARIDLGHAEGGWSQPPAFDADAAMAMRDVGLLLALFRQKKPLPRWVARVIDAGEAQARARVQLRESSLVLDRVQAQNRRFDLRARLRLQEGLANGDLLLQWGVLSLGIELDDSERDYRLVGAKAWYEGRPDLLADDLADPQ